MFTKTLINTDDLGILPLRYITTCHVEKDWDVSYGNITIKLLTGQLL